jgi:hypothetical protein
MAAVTTWGLMKRGAAGKQALPERDFGKSVSMQKVCRPDRQKIFCFSG